MTRSSRALIAGSYRSGPGTAFCARRCVGYPRRSLIRAPYATSVSPPSSFQIPKTESEVAELLAKAGSTEERKKIFESLLGVQELASKVPPKARGPAGVHLIPIGRAKLTTDQTGVDVHHSPFESLSQTYQATLKALEKIPASTVYRQSVESITRHNLEIVNKFVAAAVPGEGSSAVEARVQAAESELGVDMIEKAVDQAEDEHQLALKMIDFQAWQELEEKPLPGQWDYFEVPPSTSYPKN